MKIRVIVQYDAVARLHSVVCEELPGCTSCGRTPEEAVRNFREALALYLKPSPEPLPPGAKEVVLSF